MVPVSWPTVHAAFVTHADRLLVEPGPVEVLGIDETRRGRPRWSRDAETGRWVRLDRFETNFVDFTGKFVERCHVRRARGPGMLRAVEVIR